MADSEAEIVLLFTKALAVDVFIAKILIAEGFTCLEEIAYVPRREWEDVAGVGKDLAKTLQLRALRALLSDGFGDKL
jgi:transcription termination/antitermination protein NusA